MLKKIIKKKSSANKEIKDDLKKQLKESEEEMQKTTNELFEQIQSDLEYVLEAKQIGEKEYGELDEMLINLLDDHEYKDYLKVKKDFFRDKEKTIHDEFQDEDIKSMTFMEFIYFYLAKNISSYFYKNLALGYTKEYKKLLENNGLELKNIDWDNIEKKEADYEEVLIDIVFLLINDNIKSKNKVLFGIDIGLGSKLFFIKDKKNYDKIKLIETNFYYIYDNEYLKNFYTSLFEISNDLGLDILISKGDFVELIEKKSDEIKIRTLFKTNNKEYTIKENNLKKIF